MTFYQPIRIPQDSSVDVLNALAEAGLPHRRFLRARWFTAGAEALTDTVILKSQDGEPLAALPLVHQPHGPLYIAQVAGPYWPFRGGPMLADASVEQLAEAFRSAEVRKQLGSAWRLGPVIADDEAQMRLESAARTAGWHALHRPAGSLFELDLIALQVSGTWHSSRGKQKDRWRVRQLEKTGPVTIRSYSGTSWTAADRDAMAAIEAHSWVGELATGGDTKFHDPALRRMWEDMCDDRWLANAIRGFLMFVGETPAAFTFGLDAGDTRYCIANNFDQRFSKFSPGRILLYHDFEDAADRGIARIDWGIGDAGYKQPMGAHEGSEVIDVLFVRGPLLATLLAPIWQREAA